MSRSLERNSADLVIYEQKLSPLPSRRLARQERRPSLGSAGITNAKFVSKHAKFVNTINNYGSRFIHFDDYSSCSQYSV